MIWSCNTGGGIRYDLTGSAPNRTLKIEFYDLSFQSGDFHLKFQVWLYEGTNEIEFRYGDDGQDMYSWSANTTQGISIGINDERANSFMRIIPGPVLIIYFHQ